MSEIMTGESTLMQFIVDVAKLLGVSDDPYVEAGDGTLFYPNIKPSSEGHNYSEAWAVGDGDTIGVMLL